MSSLLTMDRPPVDRFDLWVDFQRMQDDGRLLARARNARSGLTLVAGSYIVVGSEDAEPAVAQVLTVTAEGSVELRVLPGTVAENRSLLSTSA